ncbi:copper chaperone PCu(A)C [Corynebacterium sp. LK2510]|uniref:copper chaperone PCu(A)C n=1 Tax=Corynebacterium sp. LK2510 TaxID=3110472 RepID=UPI0034CF8930
MRNFPLFAAVVAASIGISACTAPSSETSTVSSASTSSETAPSPSVTSDAVAPAATQGAGDVVLDNATVRAKTDPSMTMTAIFGTLRNTSDRTITITGFTTSLGEARYELHETVDGTMRPVETGFEIPAGGTRELGPGGDHMMILDYAPEIPAGDTVDITLDTADGAEISIPGVAVRTMIPGHEDYADHADHADREQQ